jgi:hypothetical protein
MREMLELEKKEKYDSRIYGSLKAEFLTKLDFTSYVTSGYLQDQEKRRQELVRDIVEGKFFIKKQ